MAKMARALLENRCRSDDWRERSMLSYQHGDLNDLCERGHRARKVERPKFDDPIAPVQPCWIHELAFRLKVTVFIVQLIMMHTRTI